MHKNLEDSVFAHKWIARECTPQLISIVLPTYNRAIFILDALESVWRQSYRPLEVHIVDDGSEDNTRQVVESWRSFHLSSAFTVNYVYQSNLGVSAARNKGTALANGEFIFYLDSDDVLHPRLFESTIRLLHMYPQHNIASFGYREFQGAPSFRQDLMEHGEFPTSVDLSLKYRFTGLIWTYLFRREVIRRNGPWDERMTHFEDLEYLLRMSSRDASDVLGVDEVLIGYRNHSSSRLSHNANYCRLFDGFESLFNDPQRRHICETPLAKFHLIPIYQKLFANAAKARDAKRGLIILNRLSRLQNSVGKVLKYRVKHAILFFCGWRGYFIPKYWLGNVLRR